MTVTEIASYLKTLGEPPFRAEQLFAWLHRDGVTAFSEMTNLPKSLRETLTANGTIQTLVLSAKQISKDGTVKYLFGLDDGNRIETVALAYEHGLAVCISTQVGCAMGCAFCASTVGGKKRDLTPSEMLAQVYRVAAEQNRRVDSVVLMGIGEPLDNFDSVVRFGELLTDAKGYNMAARSVTVSTCGIVPNIKMLTDLKKQWTLSVSLHAADNAGRTAIMPVNQRYPLEDLIGACKEYARETGRRVTFEYAVIHGQNDSEQDADKLANLLRGMGAHVNLIPVNPARDKTFHATRQHAVQFQQLLEYRKINATVRRTLGADIDAACGQLRQRTMETQNTGGYGFENHCEHPSGLQT